MKSADPRARKRWITIGMLAVFIPLIIVIGFPWFIVNLYYHTRFSEELDVVTRFSNALAQGDLESAASLASGGKEGLAGRLKRLSSERRQSLQRVLQPLAQRRLYVRGIQDLSSEERLVIIDYPERRTEEGTSHVDFILGRTRPPRIQSISFVRIPGWSGDI